MEIARLMQDEPERWLSILTETYKISVVCDGDYASLKYNQIESPMHEQIVQECRGLVVNVPRRLILAYPYRKFWNYGEKLAAPIDWSTANVLEKLDGSLMILYWDPREESWAVASSGTPKAGGRFGDADETFGQAFWRTFDALKMRAPGPGLHRMCFMFEFCDEPNRIVVKHDRPRIVLHGARDLDTHNEAGLAWLQGIAARHNWECVKAYPLATIEACLSAADALDPIAHEGFIVVDAAFNRVKIKSPRYVALHHMKGEATERRAIQLWQTGETSELLAHFPEFAPKILPVHERLDALAADAARAVNDNAGTDRKAFALAVKDRPVSSIAFKLYGRTPTANDAAEIMRAQTVQALERMLEAAR